MDIASRLKAMDPNGGPLGALDTDGSSQDCTSERVLCSCSDSGSEAGVDVRQHAHHL
jgi:hypothetical protein